MMQQKYGQPSGMTPERIIWEKPGPYKTIIAYKEPVQHDFPKPHKDVLEHVINYDVPAEKFTELAKFDGSIIAEETKGTLAARCDSEPHNLIALNLADDIVKGKKGVEEARQAYAEAAKQLMKGQTPAIAQKLQFDPPQQAGDPGVAIMGKQAGQPDEAQPAGEQQPAQGQQQKPQE